jgi:hypothetical protein
MKRFGSSIWLLLALFCAAHAQQPAQQFAWDVKLSPDTTARSNLAVQNLCKKKHSFRITLENVTFMRFQETEVSVGGRKTYDVPVIFDTARMTPGVYLGQVIVTCLTCRSEGACTQDREVLAVRLEVTGAPGQSAPSQPQPETSPLNTERSVNTPSCSDDLCEEARGRAWHLEDGATAAENTAEEVRAQADSFEQAARDSEESARRATTSAKATSPGIVDETRQRGYPGNAFGAMNQVISQIFVELRAGKIRTEQAQQRTEDLLDFGGLDRIQDETSRSQAQLRYAANQMAQSASQARAAASGAQEAARAAQTAANGARQEAQQARNNFEGCANKVAAGCRGLEREQQAVNAPPQDRPEALNILFNTTSATSPQAPANPCEQLRLDCERLRFEVANLESQLTQSQAVLDAARREADRLEAEAQKTEEAARRASEAAKETNPGRGRIIDESRGRVYTEGDFAARRAAIRQVWRDYGAGKITAEQAQAAAQQLTGLDSLDRIQDEANRDLSARRYDAQQAAKKGAEARAAANAARAAWQSAQARVAAIQQSLQKARAEYEACLKKFKEACARQQQEEARLAAEQRRAAEALARKEEAARRARERDARRPTAPAPQDQTEAAAERRRRAREENKYLISNMRALNMLPPASPEFDNFLAPFLAEDNSTASALAEATPEFKSTLDAIYNIRARLTDACAPSRGREAKLDQLQKMQNSKTGRLYTAGEAEVKLRNVCALLRQLKSRVESLPR